MPTRDKNTHPTPRKRPTASEASAGVTRRQFLIGAGVTGGLLALGGGTYFALNSTKAEAGSQKLTVANDQVFSINDLELVDDVAEFLQVTREIKLPYNTLVTQQSPEVLSVLESTGEGYPALSANILQISSGKKTEILRGATSDKPRFEVLDFNANENGFAWIECNVLTGENVVYTSKVNAEGATVMLTCDSTQKMPHIAIAGSNVWVQTAPQDSTSGVKEKLFMGNLGDGENELEQVIETRSFATPPIWTSSGIVVTPRNSYTTSAYDVRLLDSKTGDILDNLTLPQSMLPQDVTYGKTGFSFTFQGSYSYGNGISNIGTYVQSAKGEPLAASDESAKDQRNSQLSNQTWLGFNREPTCPCAWIGNYVCVKSTSSVAVIDMSTKRYALIKSDDGADDYGVWLVSTGEVDHLVTLQNINYTPLSGSLVKECRLKIWQA